MADRPAWSVEHRVADAAALHAPWPAAERRAMRQLRWSRVSHPAVVLGSTQDPRSIDTSEAARQGLEVVRRSTGGGAVLVRPDAQVWFDAWLPQDDPLWEDDVVVSARWMGSVWERALREMGVLEVVVHTGGLVRTPLSDLVCFAGVGPGEILVGGRKLVGIAQRRTRDGSWFHTSAPLRWDPQPLVDILVLPPEKVATRESLGEHLRRVAIGLGELPGIPGLPLGGSRPEGPGVRGAILPREATLLPMIEAALGVALADLESPEALRGPQEP
jgi:lipoate-protein ligase A